MFEGRWVSGAQAEIREKFLAMAKHLRGRPNSFRSPFDEAGGARQTPGWSLVHAGRACLDVASGKGVATLAATRDECRAFCDALYAAMVHGHEPTDVSPDVAILELVREQHEAGMEAARFAVKRDSASRAAFLREVSDVVPAATRVLSLGSRLIAPTISSRWEPFAETNAVR
jgi:hypothetical protein